jgi:hypothetical protein
MARRARRPLTGAEYRRIATKEADVQAAAIVFLQTRRPPWLVMITDSAMSVIGEEKRGSSLDPGQADLVAVRRNELGTEQVLLVECKRPKGGRVRESQKLWHLYAEKFGFRVWIVRDFETLEALYNQRYGS